MIDLSVIPHSLQPLVGSSSPLERLEGARRFSAGPLDSPWMLGLGLFALALAAVGTVAAVVFCLRRREQQRWARFHTRAERMGLSTEESRLLANLVQLAEMKNPDSALVLDTAFERAAASLTEQRQQAMSPDVRLQTNRAIHSLRVKLGFAHVRQDEEKTHVSSQQIPEASSLELTFSRQALTVGGVALACLPDVLAVLLHTPVECETGDAVRVRYSNLGAVWEFDTFVSEQIDDTVLLDHTERIRFVNRRRFPRIPTEKPGALCPFPFLIEAGEGTLPVFSPATLVEIGGPGLKVRTTQQLNKSDRALVIVHFEANETVQALGRVRRVDETAQEGLWEVVVELVDLASQEVAYVARQTNALAQERTAGGEHRDAEPQAQPAGAH